MKHGRPDKEYQMWRWQPHGCSLPSFNATLLLEKLRRKRMMFVGDSLNRGQYVSMICLLHRIIPEHAKFMEILDFFTVFRAEEYNATIEHWAPFLLESNSDNAVIHRVTDRIVRKGSINKHGQYWKGVEVLALDYQRFLKLVVENKWRCLLCMFYVQKVEGCLQITCSCNLNFAMGVAPNGVKLTFVVKEG